MTPVFPKEILPWHMAILGKTGKGKSTTARDLIEQVVPEGSRVCILDTTKSDWWGITSSADGKKPGLPFTILGGPHAHLPLNRNMGKAIADVVANGSLPLSIIDMADFGPGDVSHFFVDFAPQLMKKMKGVLYLVIEEAHEVAPKERAGFAKENMGVYWAKKLATAGRMKGLRIVVLSQRTQALHNAVLGSCETLIVHGMTAPADQDEVIKWLKANVKDKEIRKQVEESLSSLPTGTGWICSGEAKLFELKEFPRAKTFDNTATPKDDAELKEVKTATIDVEKLRTILGAAVQEAEANDPTALKRRIAELERDIRNQKPAPAAAGVDPQAMRTLQLQTREAGAKEGYEAGYRAGWPEGRKAVVAEQARLLDDVKEKVHRAIDVCLYNVKGQVEAVTVVGTVPPPSNPLITPAERRAIDQKFVDSLGPSKPEFKAAQVRVAHHTIRERVNAEDVAAALYSPRSNGHDESSLTPVQQRIINAMAELEQMRATPSAELISFMTGYGNIRSKGFKNAIGALRTGGLVDGITLTDAGRAAAQPGAAPLTTEELQRQLILLLGNVAGKILKPLINRYPDAVERQALAEDAGYENMRSKGFVNALGRLRTLGFIDYQGRDVVAKPVLFLQ